MAKKTRSKKIAHLIIQARRSHRIDSTTELASIICQALGIDPQNLSPAADTSAPPKRPGPSHRRYNELGNLESLLNSARDCLPRNTLAVYHFHSLEESHGSRKDFKNRAKGHLSDSLPSKPIEADLRKF